MTLLDNTEIRSQFPATGTMLYLDAAHRTPLCVPVRARLDAFYDEALYTAGPKARWLARIEDVRGQLARLLGVGADEIAFTKNTSDPATRKGTMPAAAVHRRASYDMA